MHKAFFSDNSQTLNHAQEKTTNAQVMGETLVLLLNSIVAGTPFVRAEPALSQEGKVAWVVYC